MWGRMRFNFLTISFLLLSWHAQSISFKDLQWEVASKAEGITVYTPKSFDHKSGIVPIKFEGVLNHHASKVISVLADDTRKKEWLPRTEKTKILEKKSLSDFTVYYRYSSPWPFLDRDFVIRNLAEVNKEEKWVKVKLESVEHAKDPGREDKSTVRGYSYGGYSIIQALDDHTTRVEMGFMNDFGGNIPTWIINIVQKKWPYGFIKNLRSQLAKKDIKINPDFEWKNQAHSLE
ncbi:MAG: hypothetical protein CME62_12845 [Halobacteriovoraceae bacterium]|nr:hypothetical protein [Halobacteriovoraceae bacterium]|tara:strand:- start:16314 stop:17012 length:699 start_codon:yes stop_codon:yes gene_type:complete